jgi:hypothetical protein
MRNGGRERTAYLIGKNQSLLSLQYVKIILFFKWLKLRARIMRAQSLESKSAMNINP